MGGLDMKMSDGKAGGGVRCPDPSWKRLQCFFSLVRARSRPPLRRLQLTCESSTGAGLIMGIRMCIAAVTIIAAVIGVAGTNVTAGGTIISPNL